MHLGADDLALDVQELRQQDMHNLHLLLKGCHDLYNVIKACNTCRWAPMAAWRWMLRSCGSGAWTFCRAASAPSLWSPLPRRVRIDCEQVVNQCMGFDGYALVTARQVDSCYTSVHLQLIARSVATVNLHAAFTLFRA